MIVTVFLLVIIALELFLLWRRTGIYPRIFPNLQLHQKGNPEKIIWSYWHDQNLPPVVQLALLSWQHFHPDWTIYFLTSHSLSVFITSLELPPTFSSQSHAHQADIIRIILLEKYGGIWIDSSIIIQKRIDSQWFPQTYDVGGFYISDFTTDPNYKVFENWFIAAPRNSPLIKAWKNEFFRALSFPKKSDYIAQLEKEKVPINKIKMKEYLMMHCCFIKVLKDNEGKFNIRQIEVGDKQNGPLYYLGSNGWDTDKAVQSLINPDPKSNYIQPVIKLRGGERSALDKKLTQVHPDSVVGKIAHQVLNRS